MTSIILTSRKGLSNGLRVASRRLRWCSVRSSSSAAAKSDVTDIVTSNSSVGVPYSLYMWGTNQKGTIPVSNESSSSSNLLNSSKDVYDHPISIDLQKAYNIGKSQIQSYSNLLLL